MQVVIINKVENLKLIDKLLIIFNYLKIVKELLKVYT